MKKMLVLLIVFIVMMSMSFSMEESESEPATPTESHVTTTEQVPERSCWSKICCGLFGTAAKEDIESDQTPQDASVQKAEEETPLVAEEAPGVKRKSCLSRVFCCLGTTAADEEAPKAEEETPLVAEEVPGVKRKSCLSRVFCCLGTTAEQEDINAAQTPKASSIQGDTEETSLMAPDREQQPDEVKAGCCKRFFGYFSKTKEQPVVEPQADVVDHTVVVQSSYSPEIREAI